MTTDRAALEKGIDWLKERQKVAVCTPYLDLATARALQDAVTAHLATLPKTKPADVHLVAHMTSAGTLISCHVAGPTARALLDWHTGAIGGQLVEFHGVAQVPA